jgi:hypothetical protein
VRFCLCVVVVVVLGKYIGPQYEVIYLLISIL